MLTLPFQTLSKKNSSKRNDFISDQHLLQFNLSFLTIFKRKISMNLKEIKDESKGIKSFPKHG